MLNPSHRIDREVTSVRQCFLRQALLSPKRADSSSKILVSSIPNSFLFKVSILLLTGNWASGELARSASLSGRQQALSPGAHSDRVFEQFPAHILRMAEH